MGGTLPKNGAGMVGPNFGLSISENPRVFLPKTPSFQQVFFIQFGFVKIEPGIPETETEPMQKWFSSVLKMNYSVSCQVD